MPNFILNSRTSRVDGSSEGGRINTENLPNTLIIYGTALADAIRAGGYRGKVNVDARLGPDGIWELAAVYDGDEPEAVPERWHGRRVVLEKAPPAPEKK
jgi:hypothetical protein